MMSSCSSKDIWFGRRGALLTGLVLGVGFTYLFLGIGGPPFINGIIATQNHPAAFASGTTRSSLFSELNNPISKAHKAFEPGRCEKSDYDKRERSVGSYESRLAMLVALWEASPFLSLRSYDDPVIKAAGLLPSAIPRAPHLEDCEAHFKTNKVLDMRGENGTLPSWISLNVRLSGINLNNDTDQQDYIVGNHKCTIAGPYPPWVQGADEENLPMTRRVQQDIWLHQHPKNCHDSQLRFLLADWERDRGFGMGAQFAAMAGMLAIALDEQRILVTNYYNRANHEGCVGSSHSHWSCYFFPETSEECRNRALMLTSEPIAWERGLITSKTNYTSKRIWTGKVPTWWGKPWEEMKPTTEIDGKMLVKYRAKDRRWWRAQALRYLMRFKSKYTCMLLNLARHQSFGSKAALMVLETLPDGWPKVAWIRNITEIEHTVWDMHKPWVPRPLLSIHVRQGDKAGEMKIFDFQAYMSLAHQIRSRFPDVRNIWLSTEMQDVIDSSKLFTDWNFYFTNISRQVGNMSMPAYEASLGKRVSTNYPLVNFLMAIDADFFIGALGSTWCYLIDGMRSTGGKIMAGYLSVNKYRFW